MTERATVEATIAVVPVLNGWRAVIYLDGKAVKQSPTSHDRDVAMLYAKHMEAVARELSDLGERMPCVHGIAPEYLCTKCGPRGTELSPESL